MYHSLQKIPETSLYLKLGIGKALIFPSIIYKMSMNENMRELLFNIRMSIIPSPYSRQMKNNTFLVQYSDEIIT